MSLLLALALVLGLAPAAAAAESPGKTVTFEEISPDPDRAGVYTFDYTLFNLLDEAQRYTLNANVYTQNAFQDENGIWYADYLLTELNALTTYTVDGKEILPEAGQLTGCDFNGDGKVDEADGQALLDCATGKLDSVVNPDKADLIGDGEITAYDAELFLSRLGSRTVELPANGEVTVTVTITLPDALKEELDKIYVNGAYIEAYVYAEPLATDEGVLALLSLESPATLSACGEKDGKLVFGYADYEPIAEGEIIATLRLKLNARESAVTLTETERGGKALEEKTTLTLRNVCDGKTDCPSAAFSDLDTGKWYHEYTDYVLEKGLMKGMGDGIFAPEGSVTRGMMVTVLYRMAGEPEVKNAAPFTDVAQGRYYAKAVAWAYENGIVKGMTDTTFAPNASATREQLVTLLYRYAGFAGLDVSARGDALAFGDGGTVSAFAREPISWAVGEGLLKGDENGMLLPRASATRAQLAAILCRRGTAGPWPGGRHLWNNF